MRFVIAACLAVCWLKAADDEAAVRGVVKRYVDAREQRDATAATSLFTADADQLVSTGEWRKGRDALVRGAMASSQQSPGTRTIAVESVRFVTPDIAIADGRYQISGPATRNMWTTFVMVRQKGEWRIAAIRNMLPAPAAAQ